jgi:Mn2+/Fe2+ NRAMP family transporter
VANRLQISVAYIDPGNYATDVAAGASHRFQLLFIVLLSNFIAIFLQSLCIKLGTISGMDLAQMCRAHLPKWLNLFLYFLAECAVSATNPTCLLAKANHPNIRSLPQIFLRYEITSHKCFHPMLAVTPYIWMLASSTFLKTSVLATKLP